MPEAARVTDATAHGAPLGPGAGSKNVHIGSKPAWRALPAGSTGAAVEAASGSIKSFMSSASLTPASAAPQLANIQAQLNDAAAKSAADGNAGAATAAGSAIGSLNAASAAAGTAWATASAPPGAMPAATAAYTEAIKAAMAASASAVFSAIAGAADMHQCPTPCPTPPHGPGVVTKGSNTVRINGLPAVRQGDKVFEACGGSDPISRGLSTVIIGDRNGSGGGTGDAGGSHTHEKGEPEPSPVMEATAPAPGEPVQQVDKGTHWVSIELVDEADQPVVGQRYIITLPGGREVHGGLDGNGKVRVTGIREPGNCRIRFPDLDLAAWERWRPATNARPTPAALPPRPANNGQPAAPASARKPSRPGPATGSPKPEPAEIQPIAAGPPAANGKWQLASPGDCVASIAHDTGHFWRTIWEHASNASLNSARQNPDVLLPRDAVFVPDKRQREDNGATDQHHKFRRRGEPAMLNLLVEDLNGPRRNQPYRLLVGNSELTGMTDGDGRIRHLIRPNMRFGRLLVGSSEEPQVEYELLLGRMAPVESIRGVQARLNNLGYLCGRADGRCGPRTRTALQRFQRAQGLQDTGELDAGTQSKLKEQHGC